MIHKILDFYRDFTARLNYVYRGEGHEHDLRNVAHIGGNILSSDPIARNEIGEVINVDVTELDRELTAQAIMHRGRGELFCSHYIISLAPGETLTTGQWKLLVEKYMDAMGYDDSTKFTAALHFDSNTEHCHIVACRVKNIENYPLVKDSNDYELGLSTIREFEIKYGLRQLQNPDENWGRNFSKEEIKAGVSRVAADEDVKDDAILIRRKFDDIWKKGKPGTITELVEQLAIRGVSVQVKTSSNGSIYGINYRIREAWISGSNIKKSRVTWNKLLHKEGISYESWRDNVALGLKNTEVPSDVVDVSNGPVKVMAVVQINKYQYRRLRLKRRTDDVYFVNKKGIFVLFNFNISMNTDAIRAMKKAKQIKDFLDAIKAILKSLFGGDVYGDVIEVDQIIEPSNDWVNNYGEGAVCSLRCSALSDQEFISAIDDYTEWRIGAINFKYSHDETMSLTK